MITYWDRVKNKERDSFRAVEIDMSQLESRVWEEFKKLCTPRSIRDDIEELEF